MTTPLFFNPAQNVPGLSVYGPGAGKPQRFMDYARHFDFRSYGPACTGRVTPITRDDLLLVHDADYVDGVFSGVILNGFENRDPRVPESCLWTIGSLLAGARYAIAQPWQPVCSPTSGYHHAGHNFGGGFCTFNGLLVVAAKLIAENPALKIGILDCDFHYGDGTADILKHYPALAQSIIHRTQGQHFHGEDVEGEALEFTVWLDESIQELNAFGCDLVLYQAGADPHVDDPLGGFLTSAGLVQRDTAVFCGIHAPVVWNLAGGYQTGKTNHFLHDPVLTIHYATLRASNASCGERLQHIESKK